MMKRHQYLLFAISFLLLIACTSGKNQPSGSSTDTARTTDAEVKPSEEDRQAQLQAIEDAVVKRVKDIYAHVTKAYNNYGEEGTDLSLDELYCTTSWKETVAAVNAKDRRMNEEMGFFDFDYWVMGQDAGNVYADNIRLETMTCTSDPDIGPPSGKLPDRALVTFQLHNLGHVTHMRVEMIHERGNWYVNDMMNIDDMIYMRDDMEKYLKGNE